MKKFTLLFVLMVCTALIPAAESLAVGISIDAGLTPPEGRWILRTQVRSMSRTAPDGMSDATMDRLMVPFVVVHGLRPQLTHGLRQIIEGLVRIPVSQDQEGLQLEMGNMYLLGVRHMF